MENWVKYIAVVLAVQPARAEAQMQNFYIFNASPEARVTILAISDTSRA
ncbi:hypothetical protein QUB63_16290 [Microcoleus sp. ARI1-B5]